MSAFFHRYSIILITGNHSSYIKNVAKFIRLSFKPDAVIFQGAFQPSLTVLSRLGKPVILCRPRHTVDKELLTEVRERNGLVVWTHKSPLFRANDLFIDYS